MIFTETELPGVYLLDIEPAMDERGFFARTWCQHEFQERGLCERFVQSSISFNKLRGTLRGMHFQSAPHGEAKLIRCERGAIYDVIVDVRPQSPAFGKYVAEILTAENRRLIYAPEGVAHGFLTLADDTQVDYEISNFYSGGHARGFRWDDPAFGISWPEQVQVISERDRGYADFEVVVETHP